jgi:serine protease Do
VVYGYVGVTVTAPTPRQRHEAGLTDESGVRVESVEPGSPAAAGALASGDVIVQVNGSAVADTDHFVRLIGAAPIDRPVNLGVMREGKSLLVRVTPVKRPVQYAVTNQNQRLYWRGMVLGPVPANWLTLLKNQTRSAGILVLGIEDDSPLKKQGVAAGAVITAIAGQPVKSLLDLQKVLNDVPPEKCDVRLADQVMTAEK